MGSLRWICGFVLALTVARVRGQSLADLSGDAIVGVMQTFGDKCPTTAANGQSWAPLPADATCGSVKRCDFPNQWCAFKVGSDGNPDLSTLNCQPLSDGCKKAFQDAAAADNTGATGQTTTPGAGGGSSPGTSTAGGEGATTAAPGESSAEPTGASSAAPGGDTTAATTGGDTTAAGSTPGGEGTSSATTGESATSPAPTEVTGGESSASPGTSPGATEGTTAGGSPPTEQPATGSSPAASTEAPSTGGTSGAPSGECCDFHEFCCFWASTGQCDTNKPFMVQICRKSCGTCACTGDPTQCTTTVASGCSGTSVPPGPACPCKSGDLVHKDWNPKCTSWAARGDCDKNPDYMKPMCKVSCNVCP